MKCFIVGWDTQRLANQKKRAGRTAPRGAVAFFARRPSTLAHHMANVSDPSLTNAYQEVRNDKSGKTW